MMRTVLSLVLSWGPNILESPFRVGLSPSGLRVKDLASMGFGSLPAED